MLVSSHTGHTSKFGEKNPYEIWKDQRGRYVKMFTNNGSFLFDFEDLEKVKNITWCLTRNHKVRNRNVYYVSAHFGSTTRKLHQHIMNYWGNGCNDKTIDHIDRNTLNNRRYNLRLATKTEQLMNTNKRARKTNSYPLPKEILESDIPKYIHYVYQKEKRSKLGYNEGFIIESHPKLQVKQWSTTKSMKVSIKDKLKQAKEKLNELNNKQATNPNCSGNP